MAERAFFSLSKLPDRSDHRAFNEWHQLDHRPENLVLPGVFWGERWVRSPDLCVLVPTPEEMGSAQYANMYWFRGPWQDSVAEWTELAENSRHWGRRFDIGVSARCFTGFFRPVKGYAAARVLVSPEALICRPARGIRVTLSRLSGTAVQQQAIAAWYDRERIPRCLECHGVAGAWTLITDPAIQTLGIDAPEGVTLRILFLDDDPESVEARLADRTSDHPDESLEEVLFDGYLRTIEPWHWSWFDRMPAIGPSGESPL
jgi:hypothetical protein